MELEAIIGLEVHVQLKTASKMFCGCPNVSPLSRSSDAEESAAPNSAICPICLGYPGTLPLPNEQAITWTQLAGAALNCELALDSKFDRKSYFYPDLPKGYQISQYDKPLCGKGELRIRVGEEEKVIGITRAHLEEDAAKNIHPNGVNYTLIDFNRAGTPLVEIVTEPDLRSPAEAKIFLQELQRIMRALGVSDADMEKGQLRCDANISLRPVGSTTLSHKTEIKNLNSFRNVERALAFEISRQREEAARGQEQPKGATRGFDATQGVTYPQRLKEEAADYRYFPEPDIPPLHFTATQIAERREAVPELPHDKRERFMRQLGTSVEHAQLLAENPSLADFFEETVSELEELDLEESNIVKADIRPLVQRATNVILRDVRKIMDSHDALNITPANFAEFIVLLRQGRINQATVPQVLKEMQKTGGDPDHVIRNLGVAQLEGGAELERSIDEVIAENEAIVAKIKGGKDSAIQALVGQVMRKTGGTANPATVTKLLQERLGRSAT